MYKIIIAARRSISAKRRARESFQLFNFNQRTRITKKCDAPPRISGKHESPGAIGVSKSLSFSTHPQFTGPRAGWSQVSQRSLAIADKIMQWVT